jgi:hypothetical protein
MHDRHDGSEITLFVLVASTTRDPAGYEQFKLPNGRIASKDEALAVLSFRGVPLFCTGRPEGRLLSIDVRSIDEDELEGHFENADDQFAFFRSRIDMTTNLSDSELVVAFSGAQGELYMTLAELQTWLRSYFVPNRTLSFPRGTPPKLSKAVTAVIRVGPGGRFLAYGPG